MKNKTDICIDVKVLKKLRNIEKHTQYTLGLIGWNISRSTLAKIESKVRRVTDIEVQFLARTLRVKVELIF